MPYFWNKQHKGSNSNTNKPDHPEKEKFKSQNVDTTKLTGFDPSFLERGVIALKKIEASPHSENLIQILYETEKTNQRKIEHRILKEQRMIEERQLKAKTEYQAAVQKSDLNRAKLEKGLVAERSRSELAKNEEVVKRKEEANKRWLDEQKKMFKEQQGMQRKTDALVIRHPKIVKRAQQENNLFDKKAKHEMELAKVKEMTKEKWKAKRERENADIYNAKMVEKSRLQKEEKLEIYSGKLFETLENPRQMTGLVGSFAGVFRKSELTIKIGFCNKY